MPVVVAMHHPPFQTLIGHMDAVGLLEGATELEALIAQHPNVERVICGHSRRAIQVRFGGTIAATLPSPAGQVCLELAHEVCPDLAREASSMWTLEPPGYGLHALPDQSVKPKGHMVSHLVASGQYAGPFAFHDGDQLID